MTTAITLVFPQPTLTPFSTVSPPDAAMVQLLHKEIYANAAAVTSTLGGGAHY